MVRHSLSEGIMASVPGANKSWVGFEDAIGSNFRLCQGFSGDSDRARTREETDGGSEAGTGSVGGASLLEPAMRSRREGLPAMGSAGGKDGMESH
jgi:hypothetical protein